MLFNIKDSLFIVSYYALCVTFLLPQILSISAYLYDATMVYATAVDRMVKDGKIDKNYIDSKLLFQYIKNVSFEGINIVLLF